MNMPMLRDIRKLRKEFPGVHFMKANGDSWDITVNKGANIEPGVVVNNHTVIGYGVVVLEGVVLGECVHVGKYTHISHDTRIADFVSIGTFAFIGRDVAIGVGARVLRDADIGTGADLGARCIIARDAHVHANCVVHSGVDTRKYVRKDGSTKWGALTNIGNPSELVIDRTEWQKIVSRFTSFFKSSEEVTT